MVPDAALLFTDIVESTSTTQRLGDERAAALWDEHNRRARNLLRQHNGREIGRSDGLLMLFEAAGDAARYALQYHAQMAEMGIAARAGMHVGPVVLRESSSDEVALGAKSTEAEGLAIPLASRVMAMARRPKRRSAQRRPLPSSWRITPIRSGAGWWTAWQSPDGT